ncbi:DUF6543 domain-containing protein [Pseudomonas sp. PSKL.D1]|uniref:DUF6543 domain-containing protein n=1 Tax=Pseudomonas sp. PSKL.D1 TaxID=3029060 RepID=UPI002380CE90|nr:DUF6543 domain-containing protein [Pseudomonas sp. PSKL.D1]WDY59091.1 hypothetical protein PVV54_05520 [Pseudomonas sp. PSKL.D1]
MSHSIDSPAHPTWRVPLNPSTLEAMDTCEQARKTFNALLRASPAPVQVVNELLRKTFGVDPDSAGLAFSADGEHSFTSLANLAVYARSHTTIPTDLQALASVRNIPAHQGLIAESPSHLLTRLSELDLPGEMRQQWKTYWEARAAGTASSRKDHARDQYVSHFNASLTLALASENLTEPQLDLAKWVFDDPDGKTVGGKTVVIESLSMPVGAILLRIDGEEPRLLYSPSQGRAFSYYPTVDDLEKDVPPDTTIHRPIEDIADGSTRLLDDLLDASLKTLDHDPGESPSTHAPLALAQAAALQFARMNPVVFARTIPAPADTSTAPSLFDFGIVSNEATPYLRSQQVEKQLQLLAQLDDDKIEKAKKLHQELVQQRTLAEEAIAIQLQSARWHSAPEPIAASDALLDAHVQGLLLHAQLQQLCGQITTAQLNAIESIVKQAGKFPLPDSELLAACPRIKQLAPSIEDKLLHELIIFTARSTLDGSTDGALLLYWLGEQGGLLPCANQAELALLLGTSALDDHTLVLEELTGNVLQAALGQQFAKVHSEKRELQNDQGLNAAASDLPRLKEVLEQSLQVPRHAAREAAFALIQQQEAVVELAGAMKPSLRTLPLATCQTLSQLIPDYVAAAQRSEALLAKDLLSCMAFCRPLIHQQLVKDFPGYDGSNIALELPLRVEWVTDLITGGTYGTVTKKIPKPSSTTEVVNLDTLLLENIDQTTLERLAYLKLQLTSDSKELLDTLSAGLTPNYIKNLASELDLAKAYEEHVRDAFQGISDSGFTLDLRRETLVAPYQFMLKMRGVLLHGKRVLNDQGLAILQVAINAKSPADYRASGHDIRLLAAVLTSGGTDTDFKPSSLSGITFVEDRSSGITLLYLPEHPSKSLTQHDSLEEARLSLYEQSKLSGESAYLAGLALSGDPRAHQSRILQAQTHAFSGIIGIGGAWPATTSFAEHLLNAQMGRVISAHRKTSRSNADLWMENFTYQSTMVYTYIKLAIGFLPFVGAAVGVYDFFEASMRAVDAFFKGKTVEGLEALNDVLVALIDTLMDVGTGSSINHATLRRLARQRQLRPLRNGTSSYLRVDSSPIERLTRFAGYEHPHPNVLADLPIGTHGRFRGIYRNDDEYFIRIEHHVYQVEWDATAHTWRLKGNATKGWKRAIALDGNGEWDTHYALYGTHLLGGGAGGGQVVGHLVDQLDPYWPAAIRDRLPRFLVDAHFRNQQRVKAKAFSDETQLIASLNASNSLDVGSVPMATLEAAYLADVRLGKQSFQSWDDYLNITTGRNRNTPLMQKQRAAKLVCERLMTVIDIRARRSRALLEQSIVLRLQANAEQELADQIPLLQQARKVTVSVLAERDRIFEEMNDLDTWFRRAEPDPRVQSSYERYQKVLNREFRAFYDTNHLILTALRHDNSSVVAEFLLEQLTEAEHNVQMSRSTLAQLQSVQVTAPQRRQIYQQARDNYAAYKRRLQSTFASLPTLFDEAYLKRLHDNLDAFISISDGYLKRLPAEERMPRQAGGSPRVFLTNEDQLYIGNHFPAAGNQPQRIVPLGGNTSGRHYELIQERWQPVRRPRSKPNELRELTQVSENAMEGLAAYRRQIQTYQRQNMLPVDVEHMMVIKAEELETYAARLEGLDPSNPLPTRLITQARSLRADGRSMRIAQIKEGTTPSEGHFIYLMEKQEIQLRRVGGRQMLKEHDYLQEYEVLETTAGNHAVLWYAHFHYRRLDSPFDQYSAGHIKRVVDRFRGPQWQQGQSDAQPVWRGPISKLTANQYFLNVD